MDNLLRNKQFSKQLKNDEKLQIAFDKKNNVEHIFNENGDDIYFEAEKDTIKFKRTGTLFLTYLSDDISSVFKSFIEDITSLDIEIVKGKYINAYTFYFKYFFNEYNIEQLLYIKTLSSEQRDEIINIILEKIRGIEDVTTLDELVMKYQSIIPNFKKVRKGNNFKDINKDNLHIVLLGKFAKISNFFFRTAYFKQLYKLIIEYCYFRKSVLVADIEKHDVTSRFYYLKNIYDRLLSNTKYNDNILRLSLTLPPAITTINEDGEMLHCYQIDEAKNIPLLVIFFNISLINLFESKQGIFKCKLCGSYNILKNARTESCNNYNSPSPNQTCSKYVKNLKAREKINANEIAKAERDKNNREKARISRVPYYIATQKEELRKKVDEEMKIKKIAFKNGTINRTDYLKWLKNEDIIK